MGLIFSKKADRPIETSSPHMRSIREYIGNGILSLTPLFDFPFFVILSHPDLNADNHYEGDMREPARYVQWKEVLVTHRWHINSILDPYPLFTKPLSFDSKVF